MNTAGRPPAKSAAPPPDEPASLSPRHQGDAPFPVSRCDLPAPRRHRARWRAALAVAVAAVGTLTLSDVRALEPGTPEPQCVFSEGKTACGYACKISDHQLRCAQTPQGVCSIGSGIVACWDPPPLVKSVLGRRAPRPTCVTSYGQTACGYHCVANYDQVQCAQTPFGACKANEGKVACWDPPAAVLASNRWTTPQASCETGFGKVGCGYNCIADHGVVRCSETPDGTCRSERGTVYCWDPPIESTAPAFNAASELACIQAGDDRSCGFGCLAIPGQGKCGSSRADSCHVKEDKIVCLGSEET